MDLLGSILNSMDKPPTVGEKQKKAMKKQQEDYLKKQEEERAKLKKFKENIENQITTFVQDDSLQKISMEPMDKVRRSIIHEIAEIAGLSAFSFGEEDVDRHIVVYKREFVPPPEELNAYRRGLTWDPEAAKQQNIAHHEGSSGDEDVVSRKRKKEEHSSASTSNTTPARYLDKYERLLGKETAKDAAKATQMNKQFGCVPSANKKDQRSIEQTLADIRAKKKQRLDQ